MVEKGYFFFNKPKAVVMNTYISDILIFSFSEKMNKMQYKF